MQYQHSLFQRLITLDYGQRHQLYQQASHYAQAGADILITYDNEACHLWINLKHKQ